MCPTILPEEPKITLSLLSSIQIDDFLAVWDENLKQDYQKSSINTENILFEYLSQNTAPQPLRSVLSVIRKHYDAVAIVEDPYMDLEYWDSHSTYYSSSFTRYRRGCRRLHFLGKSFSAKEDIDIEDAVKGVIKCLDAGFNEKIIKRKYPCIEYFGYCVLRPTPSFVVGRTALKFDDRQPEDWPPSVKKVQAEENSIPFLTCHQTCYSNLKNATFKIEAPEFIQQDPNLGQCATASVWVSSSIMAQRHGTNHYHFGTIQKNAISIPVKEALQNVIFDSGNERAGLSIPEIINAISSTGANPLVITPSGAENAEGAFLRCTHEVYSVIESGLPALLCIENEKGDSGHVVAAVGHSLPRRIRYDNLIPLSKGLVIEGGVDLSRHFLLSSVVNLYYAHDDNYGPYNRVCFNTPSKKKGVFGKRRETTNHPCLELGRLRKKHTLNSVLAPIPAPAKSLSWRQLEYLVKYFQDQWGATMQKENKDIVFFWRSLLVSGSDFKKSVYKRNYSRQLRAWYSALHLPKFVWLYEISIADRNNIDDFFPKNGFRKIAGEFLLDATTPTTDVKLISQRIIGYYGEGESLENTPSRVHREYTCYTKS